MLAKVSSAQVSGLSVDLIDVEVDISRGIHSFALVGLPDKAVEEARDRISAAIKNSGFTPPQKGSRKVVVSLAPADVRKEGTTFDLAIALGFLLAGRECVFDPAGKLFIGELSLNGTLRPIKGTLMIAAEARKQGIKEIFLPRENAREAALISGVTVYGCARLRDVMAHFGHKEDRVPLQPQPATPITNEEEVTILDFADVRGQETAKRGLEIAAAGGHNIALSGPPGTGKTMLAKAFSGILPPLTASEVLEVTGIHSAAGILDRDFIVRAPIRSPHHTSSYVSLVGGGAWPRPGEITLSHRGVLFLDEFPEFERRVIEALRQPLEDKVITVARARQSIRFPANFILIAAMNPCPCGNKNVRGKECTCSQSALARYERKISGPIIDRIDLWIDVPHVPTEKLSGMSEGELSKRIRERVHRARGLQQARFKSTRRGLSLNSEMGVRELKTYVPLDDKLTEQLNASATRLGLSARAYHRIIKIARTIADLAGAPDVTSTHLSEALTYRPTTTA